MSEKKIRLPTSESIESSNSAQLTFLKNNHNLVNNLMGKNLNNQFVNSNNNNYYPNNMNYYLDEE